MTALNTIMAQTLKSFRAEVDGLISKGDKKEVALMHVIQKYIVESKNVLFEGDGYSEEWEKEAEQRGLPNVKTTPFALDAMITEKAKNLFAKNGVYSHAELEARHEIELEKYIKIVQIEARLMGDLATNHILPAAIRYQNVLAENIKNLKEIGIAAKSFANQKQTLETIADHINSITTNVLEMVEARKVCNNMTDTREKAIAYCRDVKEKYFDTIRYHVDKLEMLVSDDLWTLPKYRELLFLR
jgi:glutamine synthetase